MLHSSDMYQGGRVSWKSVRLELARSPEFPRGSASRAFLLRLPLCGDGSIDAAALDKNVNQAIVRRFWASDADQAGKISRLDGEWLLICSRAGASSTFVMQNDRLVVDQNITIVGPDAVALPFRVVSIEPISASPVAS